MTRLSLAPHATLVWPDSDDWRCSLFQLAASRDDAREVGEDAAAFRFWRSFAQSLLMAFCRLPGDSPLGDPAFLLPAPSDMRLDALVEGAPPMPGGEYLSRQSLRDIWTALAAWCVEEAVHDGGLDAFFEKRAPRWRRVGRVAFHLAENKTAVDAPFAFLATYTVGLNREGRPVHQVLGEALTRYAGEGDKPALICLLSPVPASRRGFWPPRSCPARGNRHKAAKRSGGRFSA